MIFDIPEDKPARISNSNFTFFGFSIFFSNVPSSGCGGRHLCQKVKYYVKYPANQPILYYA